MRLYNLKKLGLSLCFIAIVFACKNDGKSNQTEKLTIPFEKYVLHNGLNVVLHEDHSDPIVAVTIQYKAGSNRETPGHTGFAHLFEHMLFQESEHVPQDQYFKIIQDAGGTLNGGTWQDGTLYYEMVPKNALETVLWLESDRMGYFINTVTQSAFENQQEVVQNEKRQRVDNQPYGHTNWVIDKNLYPFGHPYSWQVIGELKDLQNASVEDVKEFYKKFYGPNNATLVIAGDIDPSRVKNLIEKYFGEIKKGEEVTPLQPQNVTLAQSKNLFYEDNFATTAQFTRVWPTVEEYNPDAYALNVLGEILSTGKKSPFYKVMVEDKKLTAQPYTYYSSGQLAGKFIIKVTANSGVDLDSIVSGMDASFQKFENDGFSDTDLERVKAKLETDFYNNISSVLDKAQQLAGYNSFKNDPGFIETDIQNIQAVTREQVWEAYHKYIKNKPYVQTSFVPKGQLELAVEGTEMAQVDEEKIVAMSEEPKTEKLESKEEILQTPSLIDRSVQPPLGNPPNLNVPKTWSKQLDNGIKVLGITQTEVPLVDFFIAIDGGHALDDLNKSGVAYLMASLMNEGTATKTPEDLEEEIELLGSSIGIRATNESVYISGNTLKRNLAKTMALTEEMLLQPRWDEKEFQRIKTNTINGIKRRLADPESIADNAFDLVLYGQYHPLGQTYYGTVETIEAITLDEVKEFYNHYIVPSLARVLVVGDVTQKETEKVLQNLATNWTSKEVQLPAYTLPKQSETSTLYFVDVPDAKQSIIQIGNLALKRTDPDYEAVQVMNYKLGGAFNGNLNMILREEKGFTYGARSGFSGSELVAQFTISTSVRSNATLESVQIIRDEIDKYKQGITPGDLEFTKNALLKSNALRFETHNELLNLLFEMSKYNLPTNYIEQEEDIIRNMTLEEHKALANKYLDIDKMIYVIVGDAKTQFELLKTIGFDEVKLLDKTGNEIELQ